LPCRARRERFGRGRFGECDSWYI